MKAFLQFAALLTISLVIAATCGVFGASYYYSSQHGQGCSSCHEMAAYGGAMHGSAHRDGTCLECHEASLATKLRHIRVHLTRTWPETIRLRESDVLAMVPNCQKCHQEEYASWHAGPHAASYSQIFTNAGQNSRQHLIDDCLRCHGAQFNGGIRDLVQPQNAQGPCHLVRSDLGNQPAIPCQSCHQVHSQGAPQVRPVNRISVADQPLHDSLAFFDRREGMHFAVAALSMPVLHDGARLVSISPDPRSALCYQCHAPRQPDTGTPAALNNWGSQFGSGDDRTPVGVHEGLSCLSCHGGHNQNARASCKNCHPRMSNCGLDVEKMDTTYFNAKSPHNIHWVRCQDCHGHGIPAGKTAPSSSLHADLSGN
jgi:hypothetical protein